MFEYLKSAFIVGAVAFSFGLSNIAVAQDAAAPEDMPEAISSLFADAEAAGNEVSFAEPEGQQPGADGHMSAADSEAATAAAKRYIYTTLRVISNGNTRGCSSGNWNCMTRLCKADLRTQSAWRGWAGCWKKGSKFICYFECGQTRNAF
ncbi:hypothetical protein [Lentilitoribacter sp. EG35]|uniref:hypothetical protein n=1 Tax=Lentilitoribacter sp. EG35 TaxID=3234192 RepID=UPI00345F210F